MPERSAPDRRVPPRHPELAPAVAFTVAIAAGFGLGVVYWVGGQTQLEGVLLALACGGIGVGIVLWAKRFLPPGPQVEERGTLASGEEEIDEFRADFQAGEYVLERRQMLVRLLIGAGAALGAAVLFPIRSLGPRPSKALTSSPFARGTRLVRDDGALVRPSDLEVDGVLTVFPEGDTTNEFAQVLLIRLPSGTNQPRPGREGWTVNDLVAYSKICTHAGCPVGLFEAALGQLLCPCHQSTFDVYDGCRPIFGPAATSLPQLPLAIDDQGFVEADGPFSGPIGPGFWNQGALWDRDQPPDTGSSGP